MIRNQFHLCDDEAFALFERQVATRSSRWRLEKMQDGCRYDAILWSPTGEKQYLVEIKTRPGTKWEYVCRKYGSSIVLKKSKYEHLLNNENITPDGKLWAGKYIAYIYDDYWMWIDVNNLTIINEATFTPKPYHNLKYIPNETNIFIAVDSKVRVYQTK